MQGDGVGDVSFVPLNALESVLQSVRAGEAPAADFLQALPSSQVVVLLDTDPGPEGNWESSALPLVLNSPQGSPVLAIFTAPERAIAMTSQFPAFCHGLQIDCAWMLQRISAGVGLVVNPGTLMGMEIPPSVVTQLQAGL